MSHCSSWALSICILLGAATLTHAGEKPNVPAKVRVVGDWKVEVSLAQPAVKKTFDVDPVQLFTVTNEEWAGLPIFNPKTGGWGKGPPLKGVKSRESTATPGLLIGDTFVLRDGPGADAKPFQRGVDYDIDLSWGSFGRLAGGRLTEKTKAYASYRHYSSRIDSVFLSADGQLVFRKGEPSAASPTFPEAKAGERRLANVWLTGKIDTLSPDHLFVVMEAKPPAMSPEVARRAASQLPKTLAKLRSGEKLRILAWGDSVTDGTYLPDPAKHRWQQQLLPRLRQKFPKANLELATEAWGGRNTTSYLNEPPGSVHNYKEKVLGAKPDLVISEFVNDAGLNPRGVEERYGKLLRDFQAIGAEWIILTPHYVRPDWMGLTRERDIDDDPRPYVQGLRQFAAKNPVGLADAARLYGRLWRQGIPYNALMTNAINHPNAQGMAIFVDAILEILPE